MPALYRDNAVINAHSGKYMMAVKANSTAVKQIAVQAGVPTDFTYTFGRVTPSRLFERGMNHEIVAESPSGLFSGNPATLLTAGDLGMNLTVRPTLSTVPLHVLTAEGYVYSVNMSQYFEITGRDISFRYHYRQFDLSPPSYITGLAITSVPSGAYVSFNWLGTISPATGVTWDHYSVCLPKGIYHITFNAVGDYPPANGSPLPYDPFPTVYYTLEFFNNAANPVPDGYQPSSGV